MTPPLTRLETAFSRAPFAVFRDVVDKRPSAGPNLDVLDGIRGLAVLQVIAAHSHAFGQKGQGAVGVWLFFTLSAFLLTRPFAEQPERLTDARQLARYVGRRLRRILPAYWLLLLIYVGMQNLTLDGAVRHALFQRGDAHLWTIPQEMLFYVLLPLLALPHRLIFRGNALLSAFWMSAVAVASFLWLDRSVLALDGNGNLQRFHLGVFATGMAAAFFFSTPGLTERLRRPGARAVLVPLSAGLLAFLVLSAPAPQAWIPGLSGLFAPMGWFYPWLYAAICSLLLNAVLWAPEGWPSRLLGHPLLRVMGVASYSLYLFHLEVIGQLRSVGVPEGAPLFAATLAATFVIATFVYAWVERPFLIRRAQPHTASEPPTG